MARLSREVYLKKSKKNQIPDEGKILARLKKDDSRFSSVFGVDKNSSQAALIEVYPIFWTGCLGVIFIRFKPLSLID